MATTSFVIGIGSNRRDRRHGAPGAIVAAAIARIADEIGVVATVSPIVTSRALGPGGRDYANAAVAVRTSLAPPALLAALKAIERRFGRRPGRRWGARPLDLDILAWDGGAWRTRTLIVPHPALLARRFALAPAAAVAPDMRLPKRAGTLRAHAARLARPRPVDRGQARP